jgi:hypothetical protein
MKLRAPATPLITIDPYFSVWSVNDKLNEGETVHWTCKPNAITGTLKIDNIEYLFMGNKENTIKMDQTECNVTAMSTIYKFTTGPIELILTFTSPLLLDDLKVLSRPVSYMKAELHGLYGTTHKAKLSISVADDICLDTRKEHSTMGEIISIDHEIACGRMGSTLQPILGKVGDDVRINWGYFYLAAKHGSSEVHIHKQGEATSLEASVFLNTAGDKSALFTFSYDDIYCLQYFGENLKGYWVKESDDIKEIILRSYNEYDRIMEQCNKFSNDLYQSAFQSGGEKYAELLMLSYRQVIAAHKLCEDKNGSLLFISKECFSNACAATVDVTYPSIPLFLLYNEELVKGMLRPVFKYAATDVWYHDFAPHDVGTYPLLNGQVYGGGTNLVDQMPIEESGNMLIAVAAACLASGDFSFASEYLPTLKRWTQYLIKNGSDPDNQLCTDDFAGHLAHNCNLTVKAIMGIVSFSIIVEKLVGKEEGDSYLLIAQNMAKSWVERASNSDGTFRLTFDQPDTFSMKYNLIWDKIFRTNIFPEKTLEPEIKGYLSHINTYGMPLDNRATYTKSDWLVWSATLMTNKDDFTRMIEPMWKAYHESESRVPMTDWYDTLTGKQIGFQHRSVQGGLFIKLLLDKGFK